MNVHCRNYLLLVFFLCICLSHCLNPESNQRAIVEDQVFYQVLCPDNSCFSASGDTTPEALPTKIYMYGQNSSPSNGILGDRATTTANCNSWRTGNLPGLSCSSDLAFLSYGADPLNNAPAMHGFPPTIPIVSETETVIANDWADLWDAAILESVDLAGVNTLTTSYWTGTSVDGSAASTCEDWSSTSSSGTTGFRTGTDNTWVANSDVTCGSPSSNIYLCICW